MCDFKFIKELPNKTVKKWAAFIREMRHSKKDDPAAFDFVSPPKEKQAESGKSCSAA